MVGNGELAVDESVVETGGCGIGSRRGIENLRRTRPIDGPEAHGTRLTGGEKFAMIQLKKLQTLASLANSHNFGVGGGIARGCDAVGPCRDQSAVFGDDRGERPAAIADVF